MDAGSGESFLQLNRLKRATVRTYSGKKMVDLREFYQAGGGELKPGKKGIALPDAQWTALVVHAQEIDRRVLAGGSGEAAAEQPVLSLTQNRRVTVDTFKGILLVNVREYYTTANGEDRPSQKGLALDAAAWHLLKTHMSALTEAMQHA